MTIVVIKAIVLNMEFDHFSAEFDLPENLDFDPQSFGLDPATPGDCWLIRESLGDREIMALIMKRESLVASQQLGGSSLSNERTKVIQERLQTIEVLNNTIRDLKGLPPRP